MRTIAPLLTVFVGPNVETNTDTPADAAKVVAGLVAQLINHRREGGERCGDNHIAVRFFHATEGAVVLLNCGDISLTLELHEDDIDRRDEEDLKEFVDDIAEAVSNHGPFSIANDRHPVVHCQVDWRRHLSRVVMF
ncbi:MAG: hypothetical protein ACEQSB_01300 [Undibacterium sp.]